MVYKVLTDTDTNQAKGLLYIDRVTREPKEVHGRIVVLCAQALESVRVLFNSANRQNPTGLGNSSGALGHYLMDHLWVAGGASGEFPEVADKPTVDGPHRPDGMYVIRFRNTKKEKFSKFLRGYGFQGGGSTQLQLERARLRRGLQEEHQGPRDLGGPRGLRRVPAALGQLRAARSRRARSTSSGSPRSRSR